MSVMTLKVKDIQLQSAKVTFGRLDQTFRLNFLVESDEPSDVVEVSNYLWLNLPWNLTTYGNPYAVLDTYDAKPEDDKSPTIFTGWANYVHNGLSDAFATFIDFGANSYERAMFRAMDSNGKVVGVLNSARDRFLDPLIERIDRLVIKISKCYPLGDFTPSDAASFFNTVNSGAMTIADTVIPARGAWMSRFIPRVQITDRDQFAWRFDMEIEVTGLDLNDEDDSGEVNETYDRKILDQGMYYLQPWGDSSYTPSDDAKIAGLIRVSGQWYRRIRAQSPNPETGVSEPSTEPVLLDGSGGKLEDASPGNEQYLTFRSKKAISWAGLALPATVAEVLFG